MSAPRYRGDYDKVLHEVVYQGRLAGHWYAEARNAYERGDHALAVEMQHRGRFRSACARTAMFAHIDERSAKQ